MCIHIHIYIYILYVPGVGAAAPLSARGELPAPGARLVDVAGVLLDMCIFIYTYIYTYIYTRV